MSHVQLQTYFLRSHYIFLSPSPHSCIFFFLFHFICLFPFFFITHFPSLLFPPLHPHPYHSHINFPSFTLFIHLPSSIHVSTCLSTTPLVFPKMWYFNQNKLFSSSLLSRNPIQTRPTRVSLQQRSRRHQNIMRQWPRNYNQNEKIRKKNSGQLYNGNQLTQTLLF